MKKWQWVLIQKWAAEKRLKEYEKHKAEYRDKIFLDPPETADERYRKRVLGKAPNHNSK